MRFVFYSLPCIVVGVGKQYFSVKMFQCEWLRIYDHSEQKDLSVVCEGMSMSQNMRL